MALDRHFLVKPSLFQPSLTGQRVSVTALRPMWSFLISTRLLTLSPSNAYYPNWTFKLFGTDHLTGSKPFSLTAPKWYWSMEHTLIPDRLSLESPRDESWAQYYFFSTSTTLQITLAPICAFLRTTVSSIGKQQDHLALQQDLDNLCK